MTFDVAFVVSAVVTASLGVIFVAALALGIAMVVFAYRRPDRFGRVVGQLIQGPGRGEGLLLYAIAVMAIALATMFTLVWQEQHPVTPIASPSAQATPASSPSQ
jgi:hypothetical protein